MNYAFSNSALNQTPFRNWNAGSPLASRMTFDQDPAAGYEQWLRSMNPTNAYDEALRRLYSVFRSRNQADVAANVGNMSTGDDSWRWTNWLGNLDPNMELAKMSRESRGGMNETRFNRPGARWVSF